jgi:hypothetical protein
MAEYRIRVPQVVHESVDGEVVAIDFTTGSYFSLRGPAEAAWSALSGDEARGTEAVAGAVAERFADDADPDVVGAFLDQLVDEGLLDRTGDPATNGHGTGGLTFEKFTDMEELILLDPVHDVSEAGWPNAPA